ncbi:Baculoviral IAP repeat-containing protein 5.1 [Paramicrosporidium saccamoebae]|uniref:Baculoviral IAP repeat-containing protein 5.1 n=1 Tax=Paramicrosporidium saccamoebae TaxID=1246581 RepID=A0A2H9TLN1_9FUNG|nr:Baculoviral IAP repeat-containing protein 5.1 [Paramicrosporidium saccamoebae]
MAMAGFYNRPFPGSPDNVCCFMCNKNLDGWEASDEAWMEHVKHAAHCPLVRLDIEGSRLSTFTIDNWPHFHNPSLNADKMARAGFFYWPKLLPSKSECDDTSVCFQCGLALDGWDADDDPRHEHAKRRPECPYIRSNVAIRPCSFEFLLASKPDQNAVRHISARPQQKPTDKTFQLPTVAKKPPKASRKGSIAPKSVDYEGTSKAPVVNDYGGTLIAPTGSGYGETLVVPVVCDDKKQSIAPVVREERKASIAPVGRNERKTSIAPSVRNTRKSSILLPADDDKKASVVKSMVESTPKQSRNSVVKKAKVSTDSMLLTGFESIMTTTDLDKSLESFLGHLVSSKLSQYDRRTELLLSQLNGEAIKDL